MKLHWPVSHSRAQYDVLTKKLGVKEVHCALGFSMGGQQVSVSNWMSIVRRPSIYLKAYYWAVMYPEFVRRQVKKRLGDVKLLKFLLSRYAVICGSARTSPHNKWYYIHSIDVRLCFLWLHLSFLEGPKAALVASKDYDNGHYLTTPQHGIRAFGRVYSAWAYSQTARIYPLHPVDGLLMCDIPVVSGASVFIRQQVCAFTLLLMHLV